MALPLVLIGLAGAYFLSKNVEQKKTDARSINLVPTDLQVKSDKDIKLTLQATNPSKSTFKIDSLSLNVYYKNKVIGTIERPEPFTIKPTNDSLINLQVKPITGEAIAAVISILFNKKEPKTIKVLGAYKYFGITFPIEKTLTVNA